MHTVAERSALEHGGRTWGSKKKRQEAREEKRKKLRGRRKQEENKQVERTGRREMDDSASV